MHEKLKTTTQLLFLYFHFVKKILALVLFLFVHAQLFAQGEGNIWHFGWNAGIDFNSGSPVAFTGYVNTNEGCASICDSAGNLLFTTNGIRVYSATGTLIGNGMYGTNTTTQSALIVPFPNSPTKYYIFTADYQGQAHGLRYSIVDMTMNGGLGWLVTQNIPLVTPICEKLTAVRNTNGTDYWIIVHAYPSNEFYVYPVTSNGVGSPIIIPIGLPIVNNNNAIGCLKASPNGQKLVAARCNVANDPIEMFDFNATTGMISNYLPIPSQGGAYGVSFSPDNTKFYIGYNVGTGINLEQYNLSIANFQNFPYIIVQGNFQYHTGLQLGPDGKIYCTKNGLITMGVINNPNLAGAACNYNDAGLTLTAGTFGEYGLQNIIENIFASPPCSVNLGPVVLSCGNNSSITLHAGGGFANYIWSTGGTHESIQITAVGSYSVTVTTSSGCTATDNVNVTNPPSPSTSINSITDTLSCITSDNGAIDINVSGGAGNYSYEWSNGDTTQDLNNISAGNYSVTITDSVGCSIIDSSFTIVQINDLLLSDSSFSELSCFGDSSGFINLTLQNGLPPYNFEWSNGDTTENLSGLGAGTYNVTVTDAGGCTASDTIIISQPTQLYSTITTSADTLFCNTAGGTPVYHYAWSTGATTQFIDSAYNGTYTVTVTDINNCTAEVSIVISDIASVNDEIDFQIFPNPTKSQLTVECNSIIQAIIITNPLGQKVFEETTNQQSAICNLQSLAQGNYFVKVQLQNGEMQVKKFVKE